MNMMVLNGWQKYIVHGVDMKWNAVTPLPKEFDTRTVRKFAWLPTLVEDKKVWLETYQTEEVYKLSYSGGNGGFWTEWVEWDHKRNYIIYPKRKLLYYHIS